MKLLLVKSNPIEGVTLLEIFEAQYSEDRKVYPVSVDGYYMMLEKSEVGWTKKGMAFLFPPEVIEYIIGLLENYELKGSIDESVI
ncbi:hypothetical protein F0919_05015 [Taibaiella lutea]|uniref:Uncharacterized protein n=1 Tax=Taibaiella lutea TaxID=2608001 RepID=A0A5M6CPW3_9BACT|nr:hypothetical protein [Taibaiella lutea]KAA5537036.1 hypothetical protein F0919_05015 [Taibaiella lutea]